MTYIPKREVTQEIKLSVLRSEKYTSLRTLEISRSPTEVLFLKGNVDKTFEERKYGLRNQIQVRESVMRMFRCACHKSGCDTYLSKNYMKIYGD